jgi:hypothetical protein
MVSNPFEHQIGLIGKAAGKVVGGDTFAGVMASWVEFYVY